MNSPCYECENRVFGCYHKCDIYQTWLADYRAKTRKSVVAAYVSERVSNQQRRRKK